MTDKQLADYVTDKRVLDAMQEMIDTGMAELLRRDDGEVLIRLVRDADGNVIDRTFRVTDTGLLRVD
jgi:hypothetical protein